MKILKLTIENYKSFRSSGELMFSPSFSVIVGKNNTGKSALLEAFRLTNASPSPHRAHSRKAGVPLDENSFADIELVMTGDELRNTLLSQDHQRSIPTTPVDDHQKRERMALGIFVNPTTLKLRAHFAGSMQPLGYPSHGLFARAPETDIHAVVRGNRKNQTVEVIGYGNSQSDELPWLAQTAFPKSIYVFRAERLGLARTLATEATVLEPNGSNLAAVLNNLQSNQFRFARFNKHVNDIFPTIRQISVAMVDNQFEVRVWSVDPETEREDLAIPLQESGTGVGQVLAILYVAMTVRSGVIVIDEPNSFLHPGAAKKLIQILRQYHEHQYVLATHSAELIATANPEIIHLVKWEDGESKVEAIDVRRVDHLREVLLEIGVSFSDVFGYDRAIWVEGPTEEICFPLILEKLLNRVELGLVFVAVRNTGDFEKKGNRKKLIWEIYENLSAGALLLPASVSFSFDREDRRDQDIADLVRQSGGRAHFIARLTYENYLLVPGAIAALVNTLPRGDRAPLTSKEVLTWIDQHGGTFGAKWNGDIADSNWLTNVHAPKLLQKLINDLASPGDNFEKASHSKFLTQWIIENQPDALAEIAEHLRTLAESTR